MSITWNEATVIWELNGGGGYEWAVHAILSRPHGDTLQYAFYEDSGCSCNGPYGSGYYEFNELEWSFSLSDIKNKARRASRNHYYATSGEVAEAFGKLSKLR